MTDDRGLNPDAPGPAPRPVPPTDTPPPPAHGRRAAERPPQGSAPSRRRSRAARPLGRHASGQAPPGVGGWLGALVAVVAAAGLTFALVTANGSATSTASPPATATTTGSPNGTGTPTRPGSTAVAAPVPRQARSRAADALALQGRLNSRAAALLAGQEQGWLAALADPASAYGRQQRLLFSRLREVPFTSFGYTVVGESATGQTASLRPGQWVADVRLSYRMPGDARDVARPTSLIVTGTPDGPKVVGESPQPTGSSPPMRDLWELTDVTVVRGRNSIVVGDASSPRTLRRYAALTDRAVRTVDRYWGGGWRRPVVVVVPESVDQMAQVLGRGGTTGLDQLAAVTTGEIDRVGGVAAPVNTADRVVINPDAFDSFADDRNRQIVLTHEMTHVATRGTVLVSPPLWLEEAFADFVGYQDSGVSRATIAADLLAEVRRGRGPDRLPTQDAFDPGKGKVDDAYVASWLALTMIEETRGASGVVAFYRTAAGLEEAPPAGEATQEACLARAYARLGTDAEGFRRQWLAYLERIAG